MESPYSFYATGTLCFLFTIYSIYRLNKHNNSIKRDNTIKVSERGLVFPYKDSSLNIDFKDITELYIKNNSEDGESIIIYSGNNKNRYEFFHDYFESTEKYLQFKTCMEKSTD